MHHSRRRAVPCNWARLDLDSGRYALIMHLPNAMRMPMQIALAEVAAGKKFEEGDPTVGKKCALRCAHFHGEPLAPPARRTPPHPGAIAQSLCAPDLPLSPQLAAAARTLNPAPHCCADLQLIPRNTGCHHESELQRRRSEHVSADPRRAPPEPSPGPSSPAAGR